MSSASVQNSAPLSEFATFGEMLRFLRRRAHMTQTELSIAVGYSVSQISRLEQNERIPDPATLKAAFVPALGLGREPEMAARLLELAKQNRAEKESGVEHQPAQSAASVSTSSGTEPPPDESLPGNLPLRLTSFIGRTQELSALRERLLTVRMVTLIGPGGVGKSSLALEAAKFQHFGDGVWLVELAAIQEGDLVAQAICAALHLTEVAGRSAFDSLITYLHHKEILLLLDNCEHLITACAILVERLLRTCPNLHILATSREALAVEGEIEWAVHPLRIPDPQPSELQRLTAEELTDFEAIHLFVERARSVKPNLTLNEQNAHLITEICQQLDGMPLALELAAARLSGLTLEELAAHLQDRFTLLVGGRRTALPRQQTLRATIDWSYDLLNEAEKALLRQVAVFVNGWTLAAAEAMAEDEHGRRQTLPLLLQLINKSLVIADERGTETRYRMLESVRHYALEKLCEAGEETEARQRHFDYCLVLAEQSHDPSLIGKRLSHWAQAVAAEWINLRSAFVWSRNTVNRAERQLRLVEALGFFWMLRYGYMEGIGWLEEALAQETQEFPRLRAIALARLADLSARVGRNPSPFMEEAWTIFTQTNDKFGMGYCLVLKALALQADPTHFEQALIYHQQALRYFEEIGHLWSIGHALRFTADAHALLKQNDAAIRRYLECVEYGRKYEEPTIVRWALGGLSAVDRKQALALCQNELAYQRQHHDPEMTAAILEALGNILQKEGRFQEALPIFAEGLLLWRRLKIKLSTEGGIARSLLGLGITHYLMNQNEQAADCLQEAGEIYQEVGDSHGAAWTQALLGQIALRRGQPNEAMAYFCAALQPSLDSTMNYLPLTFLGLGVAKKMLGDQCLAAHFWGVAAQYEDKPYLFDMVEYQDFVNVLRSERAVLSNAECIAAWEAGRQMSLAEAVNFCN